VLIRHFVNRGKEGFVIMALEIKLSQKLSQSLLMTPQLQHAIKLLQLGRLEYIEAIEKELLENPILEELHEDQSNSTKKQKEKELRDTEEAPIEPRKDESPIEWDDYISSFSDYRPSSDRGTFDQEDHPSIEATLTKSKDLTDYILSQICVSKLNQTEKEILFQIIGNLNKDGYLCIEYSEIAAECNCSEEEVLEVIELIQSLDPAGLGARNLQECLLIQLGKLGLGESLAAKIVKEYLPELERKKYDLIAKNEGVAIEDVYSSVATIQHLEPRPGRSYSDDATRYIIPDIYVIKDNGGYVITLNEEGLPRLRVNPYYLQLLNKNDADSDTSRAYLTDRFKAASWLIKSIHQRQNTIYRVTESIMKFQRKFLDDGIEYLKPLVLKDVANDIGMHESTVSRVTTNKYVHTPQGVFELKYFFTTAIKTDEGSVSSSSVKEKIRALIAEEPASNPISDQQIVEILSQENISIARRTVAKYRESLGILSSSKRKKLF
jgi:RNA polymerase sigma-54 factor